MWMKKESHTKPDKLRRCLHGSPCKLRDYIGWSEHKNSQLKASHGRLSHPGTVASFKMFSTLSKAVYCLFASKITYPWNVRVIPLFWTPHGTTTTPEHENKESLIVIFFSTYHLYAPKVLIANYPVPTDGKEVCVSVLLFIQSQRLPRSLNLPPMDFM